MSPPSMIFFICAIIARLLRLISKTACYTLHYCTTSTEVYNNNNNNIMTILDSASTIFCMSRCKCNFCSASSTIPLHYTRPHCGHQLNTGAPGNRSFLRLLPNEYRQQQFRKARNKSMRWWFINQLSPAVTQIYSPLTDPENGTSLYWSLPVPMSYGACPRPAPPPAPPGVKMTDTSTPSRYRSYAK